MRRTTIAAVLMLIPLAAFTAACSDDDERDALSEDELGRELDMALQSDTTPGTFQDSAAGMAPTVEEVPPTPAPTTRPVTRAPQRTPAPRPTPQPAPAREPVPAPVAPGPRTVTSSIPSGTTFAVTLDETLSTDKNAAGDGFTATLREPILDSDGDVLIPAGATVRGRVTRVDKSGRVGETAVLNVAFESIGFGGKSYPLDGTVVAANPTRRTRQSTAEQAGKVAAGAAAGAIIGKVLGKSTSSAIKGAAVGAAAGTAIAMGTADVDVVLAAGSEMRVRIDSPITVRKTITN